MSVHETEFPEPCQNIDRLEKRKFQKDANGDVCVNVCISKPQGDGCVYEYASGSEAPGGEECFLSYTVPVGKTFFWEHIVVAFQQSGEFLVKVEGVTKMRLITSAGAPTFDSSLAKPLPIDAGDTIEVCFCSTTAGEYSASISGSQLDV